MPLSRLRTPLYKNTGSTARDHLASERTFLAWLRTGLGFIALGIAIERFQKLDITALLPPPLPPPTAQQAKERKAAVAAKDRESSMLIAALLGTGSASIAYGTGRYFSNLRLLQAGYFKPAFHGAAVMAVGVTGLAGVVFWSEGREQRGRRERGE